MPNPVPAPSLDTRRVHARLRAGHVAAALVVAALAVAALAGSAQAGPPFAFEPIVAHVQEAERVVLRPADASESLTGLSALGLPEAGPLSIADYEVVDGALEVVFRLAGSASADIGTLVVVDASGRSHEVDVGRVAVRDAADASLSPLRSRAAIAYGDGVVLGAWLFENEAETPVVVTSLELAPRGLARPFVLATIRDHVPPFAAFERWVDEGRAAILASDAGDASLPATRLEAALRAVFPPDEARRPDAPALTVPAGGAVALMLTPASLDVDLATTALLLDVRIAVRTADGAERVRYLPHPARYQPGR